MPQNDTLPDGHDTPGDSGATVRLTTQQLQDFRYGVNQAPVQGTSDSEVNGSSPQDGDSTSTIQLSSLSLGALRRRLRSSPNPNSSPNGDPTAPINGHQQRGNGDGGQSAQSMGESITQGLGDSATATIQLGAAALRALRSSVQDTVPDSGPATVQLSAVARRNIAPPSSVDWLTPRWVPPVGQPNQEWFAPPNPPVPPVVAPRVDLSPVDEAPGFYLDVDQRTGYPTPPQVGTAGNAAMFAPAPAPVWPPAYAPDPIPGPHPQPPVVEAPTGAADDEPSGRRSKLVRGGVLMTLVSVGNRISSFAAQLVLGRLLIEEDFGLFAVALGLTSVGAAVRSALQPVLISHLDDDEAAFDRVYRTTMASLWLFTLTGMAASGLIEQRLDASGLQSILLILLLMMPFQVMAGFGMARISHRLEFGKVGKTLTVVPIVRHVCTVGMAILGLGPMSLVFGAVVATFMELGALARYTNFGGKPGLFSLQTLHEARTSLRRFLAGKNRRWIWISALALTAANNGDYTVAKVFVDEDVIGVYYFAFALTAAFWLPLNLAVNTVLVPAFVRLKSLSERRERTMETLGTFAVLGVLLLNTVTVAIVPMTQVFWGDRWLAAIPAILGLSLLGPLQFVHPVIHAIQRGTGAWNLYVVDIAIFAVMTIIAAGVGAYLWGLMGIVSLVVLAEIIVILGSLAKMSSKFQIGYFRILRIATTPWLLGMGAMAVAHLVHPLDDPELVPSLIRFPVYAVATFILVVIPYRKTLLNLTSSLQNRG